MTFDELKETDGWWILMLVFTPLVIVLIVGCLLLELWGLAIDWWEDRDGN